MSLLLKSLNEKTRNIMLEEVESDKNNNRLYLSARLSAKGKKEYLQLLPSKQGLRPFMKNRRLGGRIIILLMSILLVFIP